VVDIACGQFHSVILKHNMVLVVGRNRYGQLCNNQSFSFEWVPIPLTVACIPKKVVSGWSTIAVLLEDGSLYGWGRNDKKQLGSSSKEPNEMVLIQSDVVQVAFGSEHGISMDVHGMVSTWGWNEHGNCGVGTRLDIYRTKLPFQCRVIGCGAGHSFFYATMNQ
jgi:alpha-tubulin suppressor-like RCC1 family protein